MKRGATPPLEHPDAGVGDDEAYARARARYEAEPILALVESYVLDVIGELSPEEFAEAADAAEELLRERRDWRADVRRELRWSPAVDGAIARGWRRFTRERRAASEDADPGEFARRYADGAMRLARS